MKSPLEKAIYKCGTQSALAERIGVTQQLVSFWLTKSKLGVPAEYVISIEAATNGEVSRHELRPDIYPPSAPLAPTAQIVAGMKTEAAE